MTVNVTDTVGANNTIVLDGSSKIPAFDGSLVTALSATAFTTGTLATARIDVGTTAGKVLQLDGSARIPALSGANLTNIPGPTSSTSDPTVSTNPTLGAKWINKTSGEIYICTDATAGANVWTNVGAGSGNITSAVYGGETYGFTAGGQLGPPWVVSNMIERFSFTSDGNASDFGSDLAVATRYQASASSSTHGYAVSGLINAGSAVDYIQKYAMTSSSNATDIGNATVSKEGCMGTNSETYGYHAGGTSPRVNDIARWSFASDGDAVDWADLVVVSSFGIGCSDWDNGYGYVAQQSTDQVQKFPFASQTNSVDTTQNLTLVVNHSGSNSSATHGYSAGGSNTSPHNHIDKFQFNTSNHATDVGNLATGRQYVGQTHPSSLTYGYSCCGALSGGPGGGTNTIEKFSFSSDGNASDVGDLVEGIYAPGFAQL